MANFARIDDTNIVTQVIVIDDQYEDNGQSYINNTLGLHGTWIQTSYNGNYCGKGYWYDEENGIFVPPKPYGSWILNENNQWQAPKDYPDDGNTYQWDEPSESWIEYNIE